MKERLLECIYVLTSFLFIVIAVFFLIITFWISPFYYIFLGRNWFKDIENLTEILINKIWN